MFNANLQDFMGPLEFMRTPILDHALRGDTISCMKPNGNLTVTSSTTAAVYTWKTLNGGNISTSNADSSSVTINRSGKYIIEAKPANGCAIGRSDTLTVLADSSLPVATAIVGANAIGQTQLFGGDVAASNYSTPFGGSNGLTFSWTGPNGFTSTVQNPIVVQFGTYNLVVREARNGCTRAASVNYNFSVLASSDLSLKASSLSSGTLIKWSNKSGNDVSYYEVERRTTGQKFIKIGTVRAEQIESTNFSFTDSQIKNSVTNYRIKAVTKVGSMYYSNVATVSNAGNGEKEMYISRSNGDRLYLQANAIENSAGQIGIYDLNGRLLKVQNINLKKGDNTIQIQRLSTSAKQMQVIAVYVGGQLGLSEKIIN
jgi:hypothetical protein